MRMATHFDALLIPKDSLVKAPFKTCLRRNQKRLFAATAHVELGSQRRQIAKQKPRRLFERPACRGLQTKSALVKHHSLKGLLGKQCSCAGLSPTGCRCRMLVNKRSVGCFLHSRNLETEFQQRHRSLHAFSQICRVHTIHVHEHKLGMHCARWGRNNNTWPPGFNLT